MSFPNYLSDESSRKINIFACYTNPFLTPICPLYFFFLLPVIPLFLTIPNGFASLETVYIKRSPTSGYQPLYEFEVSYA